jgi:dTDP-4-dehydrorhamnose reductase
MKDALIGHTGYVGTTLLRQRTFEHLFRSTNIHEIDGKEFDLVVCTAAPAQKWVANREPEVDFQNIKNLISHLNKIRCNTFVLISTVDVFKFPIDVNEDTEVEDAGLHPYGMHRRMLEKFVEGHFHRHLIVRLPGLVGPGLRKNVIFDFLNKNNLHVIDSRGSFQFYPMTNLWYDVQIALNGGLRLIHLTAEPICVAEISCVGFGRNFDQCLDNTPVAYDFKSVHAAMYGANGDYQYNKRETIQAVRSYAQSEPIFLSTAMKPIP